MTIIRFTLLTLHQKEPARKSRGLFLVLLLSAVRTPSAVDRQNVRGTMISPTPMRTATDIRRNECAVELRKKNPDRYRDPDSGAGNQSRTDDLVITNDVLYQLSHASIPTFLSTSLLYQTFFRLSRGFVKKISQIRAFCGESGKKSRVRCLPFASEE